MNVAPEARELFSLIKHLRTKEELDLFLTACDLGLVVCISSKNTGVYDSDDFMIAYADEKCGIEIRCTDDTVFVRLERFT